MYFALFLLYKSGEQETGPGNTKTHWGRESFQLQNDLITIISDAFSPAINKDLHSAFIRNCTSAAGLYVAVVSV